MVQCATKNGNLPKSAEIYHWAVNVQQPAPLAKIAYNPETLESEVLSYTPPSPPASSTEDNNDETEDVHYRIGFFRHAADGSKQWVGSLVSQSALTTKAHDMMLQLYLGASQQHDLYHVALAKGYTTDGSSGSPIGVQMIYPKSGALPELNRPIVVSPDGSNPQEEVEKTLFQKYVFIAAF